MDRENFTPEIGVGSPQWMEKLRKEHLLAAAAGNFIGALFSRYVSPGPDVRLSTRGDLQIYSGGLTVTIERQHTHKVADVLRKGECAFHLGTCDDDLEPEA